LGKILFLIRCQQPAKIPDTKLNYWTNLKIRASKRMD